MFVHGKQSGINPEKGKKKLNHGHVKEKTIHGGKQNQVGDKWATN
jgi:hypothetical protein